MSEAEWAPAASALAGGLSLHRSLRRIPKMSERIAHQLVDYIIQNNLREGSMLPIESELVVRLDVGRTTLREALLLLETWGVITIKPGRNGGPMVRRPRPKDLEAALALQLHFAAATLQDVIEARAVVEPMSARLAAERMGPREINELDSSVGRLRENSAGREVYLEETRGFHSLIGESTGSVVLHSFVDTMMSISHRAVAAVEFSQSRRDAVADAHERIARAIRAGDAAAAQQEMAGHIEESRVYWVELGGLVDRQLTLLST